MSMFYLHRLFLIILVAAFASSNALASEARGLVTFGMQRVFEHMKPNFEAASGQKLDVEFASTPDIAKRVIDGELVDFVITSVAGVDRLIAAGRVTTGNRFVLVGSPVAVAVPAGRKKPDISTVEKFKSTLLAATTISYTDPASGGPSGIHMATVLQLLNIADDVARKTRFPAPGGLVGDILSRSEADIGIQQSAELGSFEGIDVVGPLPRELQLATQYAAAGAAAMKARGLDPR